MVSTDQARLVAFCLPVMNRLDDLRATLGHNLEVLGDFPGRARLIIGCFDADDACERWVRDSFPEALASGLLAFRAFPSLPHWHFSWAKNAFHDDLPDRYYASLDGDNYLSSDEVSRLLELVSDAGARYLVHHFSGHWGDGTHGRVAFPGDIYRTAPYMDEILPRQFDETGLILRLLAEHPDLVFVSRPGVNIFEKSAWCRDFVQRNNLPVHHETRDLGAPGAAINPRGDEYVSCDPKLFWFQQLNASYSLWRCSPEPSARQEFLARLEAAQKAFVRTPGCHENLHALFTGPSLAALARDDALTLYAVNRDNYEYLAAWQAHYRRLGVRRFVIVDDGSSTPLEEWLPGDDTYVVRPRFGAFRTSKVFWLRALMGAFQVPGSWVLTADVDEFLDLPEPSGIRRSTPLDALTAELEHAGRSEAVGLLLDMMPDPAGPPVTEENFLETMNWHYCRPPTDELGYQNLRPIQWAFGRHWPVPLSVDIRYRLYDTLDCLRKVPVFCFDESVDLNQGFHTLLRHGRGPSADKLLDADRGLLPIRHYKLAKLFRDNGDGGSAFGRTQQYFGRTRDNLYSMMAADQDYAWRCWKATPFKRRYEGPCAFFYYRFSV